MRAIKKGILSFVTLSLFLSNFALAQSTVVLRAGGIITNASDWGDAPAGTANPLFDFSADHVYSLTANNASSTLSVAWNITSSSTLCIGDGSSSFSLIYDGSASIGVTDAFMVLNSNAYLILNRSYNFNNSKTDFGSGSTVIYSAGTSSVGTDQYNILNIDEDVATNNANVDVSGSLNIASGKALTIDNSGTLSVVGVISNGGEIAGDNSGTLNYTGSSGCFLRLKSGQGNFANVNLNTGYFCFLYNPLSVSGNFSMSGGGKLWFTGNAVSLNLDGNISFGSNQIRGAASGSISIGGSGTISGGIDMEGNGWQVLSELTLNRTGASLPINSELYIANSLNPTSGTINTNNNVLLYSDALRKGRVGPISATGNLSGNLTIYQFKPAGLTGWVNMCAPGMIGKAFSDWNASFAITCPSGCPDGSSSGGTPFTSVYSYDEVLGAGSASAAAHYVDLPGTSTSIDSKKGYWVYLGDNYPNTADMSIILTGAVNTKISSGAINISVTGGAGPENGWNLVANPYPSPIQATQVIAAFGASIDPTSVQAYDPDLPGFVPFTTGAVIPMGQAFYVRALSNAAVLPDENWKTASHDNTPIFKQIGTPMAANGRPYFYNDFLIDLQSDVVPKKFFSQAYFTFETGGTTAYDLGKDAYFMGDPIDPSLPCIYSLGNSEKLRRNALAEITAGSVIIPIQVNTAYSAQYRLKPINLEKLPSGACVIIKDLINNQSHDLRSGPYSVYIAAGASSPQFELQININPAPLGSSQSSDPICANAPTGLIKALGSGSAPWNYVWKDQNNNILRQATNVNGADTLKNLFPGTYNVEISKAGTCDQASAQFSLVALTAQPLAQFQTNQTTTSIFAWEPLHFTNQSQNAISWDWDFGNGIMANTYHASMAYALPGNYTVKLQASNNCGEVSTTQTQVQITANPIGLLESANLLSALYATQEGGELYVFNPTLMKNCSITIYDLLGRELLSKRSLSAGEEKIRIDLQPNGQMLLIKLFSDNQVKTQKLLY